MSDAQHYRSDSPQHDVEPHHRSRSPLQSNDYNDYSQSHNQYNQNGSESPEMDQDTGKYRRRLMLANVPLKHSENDLRDMFSKYGTITSIEIPELHINRETGRPSSRWAFIEMSHHSEAEAALNELHETYIDGRKFYVTYAKPKGVKQTHSNRGNMTRYNSFHNNRYNYNEPYYNDRYNSRDPYYSASQYRDPYYDRSAPMYPSHAPYRVPHNRSYDEYPASAPHHTQPYNDYPASVPVPSPRVYNPPAVPVESQEMQLYISSIGLDVRLQDVLDELNKYGRVVNYRELISKHHPPSIGSMFVSYESESQADRARAELNGTSALGSKSARGLIVDWSGRYRYRQGHDTAAAPYSSAPVHDYSAPAPTQHNDYYNDNRVYNDNYRSAAPHQYNSHTQPPAVLYNNGYDRRR